MQAALDNGCSVSVDLQSSAHPIIDVTHFSPGGTMETNQLKSRMEMLRTRLGDLRGYL